MIANNIKPALGAGKDVPIVAIWLDRSVAYVAGALASLLAGCSLLSITSALALAVAQLAVSLKFSLVCRAAFLPLSLDWPAKRLEAVLKDAQPSILLWATQEDCVGGLVTSLFALHAAAFGCDLAICPIHFAGRACPCDVPAGCTQIRVGRDTAGMLKDQQFDCKAVCQPGNGCVLSWLMHKHVQIILLQSLLRASRKQLLLLHAGPLAMSCTPLAPADIPKLYAEQKKVPACMKLLGVVQLHKLAVPMDGFALHAGILNRIQWMAAAFPWQKGDVALFKTSPAFVDSIWEMFGPLVAGKQPHHGNPQIYAHATEHASSSNVCDCMF